MGQKEGFVVFSKTSQHPLVPSYYYLAVQGLAGVTTTCKVCATTNLVSDALAAAAKDSARDAAKGAAGADELWGRDHLKETLALLRIDKRSRYELDARVEAVLAARKVIQPPLCGCTVFCLFVLLTRSLPIVFCPWRTLFVLFCFGSRTRFGRGRRKPRRFRRATPTCATGRPTSSSSNGWPASR